MKEILTLLRNWWERVPIAIGIGNNTMPQGVCSTACTTTINENNFLENDPDWSGSFFSSPTEASLSNIALAKLDSEGGFYTASSEAFGEGGNKMHAILGGRYWTDPFTELINQS